MEQEERGGMHPFERQGFLNPKFIQWVESLPLQSDDGLWFQEHIRGLGHGKGESSDSER